MGPLPRRHPAEGASASGRATFRAPGGRFRPNRCPPPLAVRGVKMAHHAKFLARTVMVPGGDVELAYRVLTR